MDVTTQGVMRYIDLRFREEDLKQLFEEINFLQDKLKNSKYPDNRELYEKLRKTDELFVVIKNALMRITE